MKIMTVNNIFIRCSESSKSRGDVWCVHGYGESGLSFAEIFDSKLANKYNIYVPDLPGFGVSPLIPSIKSVRDFANVLQKLITDISGRQKVNLIAHSLGSTIVSTLCAKLPEMVSSYVNIEGNLTASDVFFSGFAKKYDNPHELKQALLAHVLERAGSNESWLRYYASLRFANPSALSSIGRSGVDFTGEENSGVAFEKIGCKKIYIWGRQNTPKKTEDFIKSHNLNNYCFEECGHWPMIDNPDGFYDVVDSFLG